MECPPPDPIREPRGRERGRCGRHWEPSAGKGRDLLRDLSAQLKLPTKTTRDITKDTLRGARLKENKSESPRPRTAVSLPTRSCPEFTVKRAGAEGAGAELRRFPDGGMGRDETGGDGIGTGRGGGAAAYPGGPGGSVRAYSRRRRGERSRGARRKRRCRRWRRGDGRRPGGWGSARRRGSGTGPPGW